MSDKWIKARIIPQGVMVRVVTDPKGETIWRNGRYHYVKCGHYIVRQQDGTIWQCSPESFSASYELTDTQEGDNSE